MDMQHPVDNRRTDGPAHRPAETDNDDEEMRWSPSPCPRERDGIDFSMMAHDWSASWMLVVSPALGEERNRQVGKRLRSVCK